MQLHQPATDALKRSLLPHRRRTTLPCPRFATVEVESRRSSSSSSDDDENKNSYLSIRYLEHLSIHQDNPASRGLVRSMSIHEGLSELVLHDSYDFPHTANMMIPLSESFTLPAAIEPLTPASLLHVDKKKGEDHGAFEPAICEKPSSPRSPALLS